MQERVRLVERVFALAGVEPLETETELEWPTSSVELKPRGKREGNGAAPRAENGASR
jgi:hypothetical protein